VFKHPPSMASCITCHLADYQAAPDHAAQNYSQNCIQCHTQTAWTGVTFTHPPATASCITAHLPHNRAAPGPGARA